MNDRLQTDGRRVAGSGSLARGDSMPVVVDGDGDAAGRPCGVGSGPVSCCWDVNAAETLFWKSVPVRLKLAGADDRTRPLIVRILLWDNSTRRMPKTLGVILTSEDNHFFLYTMEVSEEDFANLRQDQGILVDFSMFPAEIISLLECCISGSSASGPRFQAVLDARRGDAQFSIVETNQFKHITHISLVFRQASDQTIKQYLSSRLQEVTGDAGRLSEDRSGLQAKVSELEARVTELSEFQVHGKQVSERALNELTASYEKQLVAERNARVTELAEANRRAGQEAAELAERLNGEKETLRQRLAEVEAENHGLRDQKYALDAQVSQLSAQHGSASGELAALKAEVERLKGANLRVDQEKHEMAKTLNERSIELASLRSQVADKESLLRSNASRIAELEKAQGLLEVAVEEYREQHRGAEQRFREQKAETEKGIQIIERCRNEITASKSKVKTYKAMLVNQESQKKAVEGEYERLKAELAKMAQELQSTKHDASVAKSTVEDQKQKLAEAHQQIDSNRKFISYLNTQAQLSGSFPLQGSSRYNLPLSSVPQSLPVSTRPKEGAPGGGGIGYHGAGGYTRPAGASGAPSYAAPSVPVSLPSTSSYASGSSGDYRLKPASE
eukprot:jgi/Tetstr1/450272/TSEL_037308.t1